MAKQVIQSTANEAKDLAPKRIIFYWEDDVTKEEGYQIINYDDLTTEEKATFDAYQALCESKMI